MLFSGFVIVPKLWNHLKNNAAYFVVVVSVVLEHIFDQTTNGIVCASSTQIGAEKECKKKFAAWTHLLMPAAEYNWQTNRARSFAPPGATFYLQDKHRRWMIAHRGSDRCRVWGEHTINGAVVKLLQ